MSGSDSPRPAVVVPAFSRAGSLGRLLRSAAAADVPAGTPLVIAVDAPSDSRHRPGNAAVLELARAFDWPHGPKEVVAHTRPLGLVGNVFYCGGLSGRFGAVVLLEDDLVVSRRFYRYAMQALAVYGSDARLAGISLNALWFNGFTRQPFIPLPDDGDMFFLQLSTPQGQAYTAGQWATFARWLAENDTRVAAGDGVHELFASFPADDWLAVKAKYLAAAGKYYVYPRESLTTNFGEPGTHFERGTDFFQVPLQDHRRDFRLQPLDDALAVYDGYFELLPDRLTRLAAPLAGLDFDVDLYACKGPDRLRATYALTTRRCRNREMSFGKKLRPLEANVIAGLPGEGISLARREDVDTGRAAARNAQRDNDRYFARRPPPGPARRWLDGLRSLLPAR